MSVLMLMSTLGFMLMLDADVYVDGAVSDYAVVVDVADDVDGDVDVGGNVAMAVDGHVDVDGNFAMLLLMW